MKKIGKVEKMKYLAFALVLSVSNYGMAAAASYGQNVASWLSGELAAVMGVITVAVAGGCLFKRNTIGVIGSLIGGGILTYFMYDPSAVKTIGENISKIIFK